jgi:hypothetical protein
MTKTFASYAQTGNSYQLDFSFFASLLKGTSIVSLAVSDRSLELGLSENLLVRIESPEPGEIYATVLSTLNPDETAPVRLQLVSDDERPTAALVEERLRNLRQVYAIIYLLNTGRQGELERLLSNSPNVDIETALIKESDRICLEAAGPGSFDVVGIVKEYASKGGRYALRGVSLLFGEGREVLMEKFRLENKLKQSQIGLKNAETEVAKEKVESEKIANEKARGDALLDWVLKAQEIKDSAIREQVLNELMSNARRLNPALPSPDKLPALPAPPKKQ